MFYAVSRKNYKVNAETEAWQIKAEEVVHKVIYAGEGVFIAFETPEDEEIYYQCALKYGKYGMSFAV